MSRKWVTLYVNGGALTVERDVCPPGTPAGPDPDRAEMLLAEMLASLACEGTTFLGMNGIEMAVTAEGMSGATSGDFMYPHHHAAGAALIIALEDA